MEERIRIPFKGNRMKVQILYNLLNIQATEAEDRDSATAFFISCTTAAAAADALTELLPKLGLDASAVRRCGKRAVADSAVAFKLLGLDANYGAAVSEAFPHSLVISESLQEPWDAPFQAFLDGKRIFVGDLPDCRMTLYYACDSYTSDDLESDTPRRAPGLFDIDWDVFFREAKMGDTVENVPYAAVAEYAWEYARA